MRTPLLHALAVTLISLAATSPAHAGPAGEGQDDLVKPTLLADVDAVAPGSSFTLGVRMKIKPHWHTYWVNPGEAGDATKVKLKGPAGFEFGDIQWPLPMKIDAPGGITYGYEDEVLLMIPVTVSADVPVRGDAAIEADVSWLVCKEECILGEARLNLALPLSAAAPKPANRDLFDTWRQRLPVANDAPAATKALAEVEQAGADGKSPAPALSVHWKSAPRKVEWFPVATRAVSIDNVVVEHDGKQTHIKFKPTVYQAKDVPGGRVDSVLVYEDADGRRHGIVVPFTVAVGAE
jgi:DsbC/DsbD-like thiol-disulfide interchange protein